MFFPSIWKKSLPRFDNQLFAARNAAGTHAARNDRGVGGHAAARGQERPANTAMPSMSSGRGFQTAPALPFHPFAAAAMASSAVEYNLSAGSARTSGKRRGQSACAFLRASGSNCGCSRASSCFGSICKYGFLLRRYHALFHQVNGNFERGGGGTLAVARLEHIKLAVFRL